MLSGQLALPTTSNAGPTTRTAVGCHRAGIGSIPLKDIRAETLAIQSGFKSRTQAIGERGFDAAMVDAEIASDRDREARLGLAFTRRCATGNTAALSPAIHPLPPDLIGADRWGWGLCRWRRGANLQIGVSKSAHWRI